VIGALVGAVVAGVLSLMIAKATASDNRAQSEDSFLREQLQGAYAALIVAYGELFTAADRGFPNGDPSDATPADCPVLLARTFR
jgi:hypothetical protein